MATSTGSASNAKDDVASLREDLDALREDISKLTKHVGDTVKSRAKAATDQAWSAKASAEDAAKAQIERLEREVETHPWTALGIAAAIGFVLGRIAR